MGTNLVKGSSAVTAPSHDERADLALRLARNCSFEEAGETKLFRPLHPTIRATLTQRAVALRAALDHDSPNLKAAAVADMLGSYDPRRKVTPETESELRKWLADLSAFPTWAVERACAIVKAGYRDDISPIYRPTTIQVARLCRDAVANDSVELRQIECMLNAKLEGEELSEEQRAALGAKVKTFAEEFKRGDHRGAEPAWETAARGRRERVLADIAASDEAMKLREYEALGIEPIRWGDGRVMSVALLRTLGRLPEGGKAKAKKAKARAA
jgi:hypothetical protein